MKKKLLLSMIAAVILTMGSVCGFLITAAVRGANSDVPVSGRPHSVIYVERVYLEGKLQNERLVLRSVTEKGEWKKETLWPNPGADKGGSEARVDGIYLSDRGGEKVKVIQDQEAKPEYFKTLTEHDKEKAFEVRDIAGLKAWVFKGDPNTEVVLDRAYAEETGLTPLWTRSVMKKSGREVVSEALHVIWGVKRF